MWTILAENNILTFLYNILQFRVHHKSQQLSKVAFHYHGFIDMETET